MTVRPDGGCLFLIRSRMGPKCMALQLGMHWRLDSSPLMSRATMTRRPLNVKSVNSYLPKLSPGEELSRYDKHQTFANERQCSPTIVGPKITQRILRSNPSNTSRPFRVRLLHRVLQIFHREVCEILRRPCSGFVAYKH